MIPDVKQVMVIGAGVMGSGIAAQIANAGIPVLLIDMPQKGFGNKNALAEQALDRMLKTDPAPFMSPGAVKKIKIGNLEDDLSKIRDCDWVIEVIVEKLSLKQDLYARIEEYLTPTTLISSNTSTIPLHNLIEGRSQQFQQNFAITHFFNPPRYMRLLELVTGPQTSLATFERLRDIADIRLGKGVVACHDTPGFIGNRIGTYWLQTALNKALELGVPIEEVDALFGRPLGIPKTGVFGLMDLVGLDLIPLISDSMRAHLPPQDPYCLNYQESELLSKMLAEGYTGRKGKGGFYRLNTQDGKKVKEAIDLKTGEYRLVQRPKLALLESKSQDLKPLLSGSDRTRQYLWQVLSEVLSYAASLVPEIADDLVSIDTAMKLGYNWKYGPFELMDRIGPAWFVDRLTQEGRKIPPLLEKVQEGTFYRIEKGQLEYFTLEGSYRAVPRRPGCLLLSDIKLSSKPLLKNGSASLWDLQDGVVCLEFHSKMNTIDPDIMSMIRQTIEFVTKEKDYKALVIYNEGTHFSAGANIGLALFTANIGMWPIIEQMVREGQQTYSALKYAPFPVISAPSGLSLGGGCEILLHSDAVQAHAESYIGLVEVGVGLVPAWGGCKELTARWMHHEKRFGGSLVALSKVFETIGTAKVAKSAAEAKELLFLRAEDGITMNRDRLLFEAKEKALVLAKDYRTPEPWTYALPGATARVALNMAVKALVKAGKATPYDEVIAQKLAVILTGGEADMTDKITEQEICALEIEAFTSLIRNPKTLDRMEQMLETGKPLRN